MKTSTMTTPPPIGVTRERPHALSIIHEKNCIKIDPHFMTHSHFDCEKIG